MKPFSSDAPKISHPVGYASQVKNSFNETVGRQRVEAPEEFVLAAINKPMSRYWIETANKGITYGFYGHDVI